MTAPGATPQRAQEYVTRQTASIARLRATGPNPFDYFIWADETDNILTELFGAASDERQAFRLAAIDSGRTDDQRGIRNNMTLGLHGDWGIWARLDRAEHVLRQILGRG